MVEKVKISVEFNSIPRMFWKEKEGLKCNTVRKTDFSDLRFEMLDKGSAKFIKIQNTETPENFIRKIKDVTFWNDLCIISWEHEEDSKDNKIQKQIKESVKEPKTEVEA